MLFFKKEIFPDKKSVPGRHSLYFLIVTPFMNLFENKMPPNVALALCIVVGIPAFIDCLTTGIILAREKPKNPLEDQFPLAQRAGSLRFFGSSFIKISLRNSRWNGFDTSDFDIGNGLKNRLRWILQHSPRFDKSRDYFRRNYLR